MKEKSGPGSRSDRKMNAAPRKGVMWIRANKEKNNAAQAPGMKNAYHNL
jgi:hypothetical protein